MIVVASNLEQRLDSAWSRIQAILTEMYPGRSQNEIDEMCIGLLERKVIQLGLQLKRTI